MRRRGHSVSSLTNADATQITRKLDNGAFDALFISVASFLTLEISGSVIKQIRKYHEGRVAIVVGGAILDYADDLKAKTGADLVTSDVEHALAALKKQPETQKVDG